MSATDTSEVEELISLRLQGNSFLELAKYRGDLLNETGKREKMLLDQLAASQKNLEAVTLVLNPGHGPVEKTPRRSWWPWKRDPV